MSEIIPFVPSVPYYEFSTGLNGEEFFFQVRWNGREEAWHFDIFAQDRTPILSGVKIVLGTILGDRNTDPRYPNGVIKAYDTSGNELDATFDDLGVRVLVNFYSYEEITDESAV